MKTIIFVCHVNICRSPCAEVIANSLIKKYHLEDKINVFSRALSYEEYGNDIYPPMNRVLTKNGYTFPRHFADKLSLEDISRADVIYYMDASNYSIIKFHYQDYLDKFELLSKYSDGEFIEDPWYTDRFDYVYSKIFIAVDKMLRQMWKS